MISLRFAASFAVLAAAFVTTAAAQELRWTPQYKISPYDKAHLTPADIPGPNGRVYPDFTYAGIQGGIPKVETRVRLDDLGAVPNDGLDDTDAFEKAIEVAAEQGGGAIELSAGEYHLSRPLLITHDNIVIRGQGKDATRIVFSYALERGETRLISPREGATITQNDFLENHAHTQRLKKHQFFVNDTLLFERGPDFSGGDRFWLKLPVMNFTRQLSDGPAVVRSVVTRYDGTVSEETRNVVFDLSQPPVAGSVRDISSVASIAFAGDSRSDYGGKIRLSQDGKRGDTVLTLNAEVPFQPGDLIVVEALSLKSFTRRIGSWREDIPRQQMFVVKAVQGNQLQLNQPLRMDYPVSDRSQVYGRVPIKHCGVEGLTLEHTRKQWIDGITFSTSFECWVKDVRVQKAGRNPLVMDESKFFQAEDSEFNEAWFSGGGGTGYIGFGGVWDCLMQRISCDGLRHAPNLQSAASGNVVRDSRFTSSDVNYHMQWAPENLIEQCYIDAKRGTGSYGYGVFAQKPEVAIHGPGGGPRNVIWNNHFVSPRSGVYLGGSNENWLIMHNVFEVESGAGMVFRKHSFDHILEGNVIVLKESGQPAVMLEDEDCIGIEFINNQVFGAATQLEGKAKFLADKGNHLAPLSEAQENLKTQAPVPSLYLWQLQQKSSR